MLTEAQAKAGTRWLGAAILNSVLVLASGWIIASVSGSQWPNTVVAEGYPKPDAPPDKRTTRLRQAGRSQQFNWHTLRGGES